MDISKLFQVLVVGGSLLATSCADEDPPNPDSGTAAASTTDARSGDAAGQPVLDAAMPDAVPLQECGLCPNECCEYDEQGEGKEKDGFICCWGTMC